MSDLIPERPDRAIARILAGGLDDWRDTTTTVTTPVTIEHGHRHQRDTEPTTPARQS